MTAKPLLMPKRCSGTGCLQAWGCARYIAHGPATAGIGLFDEIYAAERLRNASAQCEHKIRRRDGRI
jgi:hypothetical protein